MRPTFYRRVRVLPWVWLNFSGSGISVTIGIRGFRRTYGKQHVQTTVSLPGSGIRATKRRRRK